VCNAWPGSTFLAVVESLRRRTHLGGAMSGRTCPPTPGDDRDVLSCPTDRLQDGRPPCRIRRGVDDTGIAFPSGAWSQLLPDHRRLGRAFDRCFNSVSLPKTSLLQ